MSITGFIILLAVIWFVTLWIMLPIGLRTQEDEGKRITGTQSGAPANFIFWRTFKWTSLVSLIIWLIIVSLIVLSDIQISEIDLLNLRAQATENLASD